MRTSMCLTPTSIEILVTLSTGLPVTWVIIRKKQKIYGKINADSIIRSPIFTKQKLAKLLKQK